MDKISRLDQPIAYSIVDPDLPIAFRVRVLPASRWLRAFIVPRHGRRVGRPFPKRRELIDR